MPAWTDRAEYESPLGNRAHPTQRWFVESAWRPMRGRSALTTVGAMASRHGSRLDERRISAAFAAVAAGVVGVLTVADLGTVNAGDITIIIAAVGSYLLYGASSRCPAWLPLAVACVSVILLNLPDLRSEGALFFVVLGLAHVALNEPRRSVVVAWGVVSVAVPGALAIVGGTDWSWQYWIMGIGFGWGFGELGYRFRRARDELASARALIADQAALDERQRIARDVHDVLGHSITIMMLQLTAARHLLRRDPDEADAALGDAERVGRDSLNQVRRTVGLLRSGNATSGQDDVGPSPTLDDLERLLADYRSAGVTVSSEVSGPIGKVDMSRSVAGYRIVQEAMANVSKHSPAAATSVTVRVDADGGGCSIVVVNRGGDARPHARAGGFGLVGMRERAQSVGGTLHAGPLADGWRVSANLPASTANAGRDE
jgi:signal transduction histidine kinase